MTKYFWYAIRAIIISILVLIIYNFLLNISEGQEINDHCYKFEGVLVCNKKEILKVSEPKIIEVPKKENKLIIKTYWTKEYTDKEICDCIWIIEGGEKANQPYGINPKYIKCNSKQECEKICLNTIKNNRKRFANQTEESDFLTFLARRYCPPNWKIWLKNLKWYLDKR